MAIATASVTLSGTDTASFSWSTPLTSTAPKILGYGVNITDGNGAVEVVLSSVSNTGGTINSSAAFTGVVDIIASD